MATGEAQLITHALDGLRADRAALLDIAAGLSPAQWQSPSGCPGWSVQDVLSHLGAVCWLVADPSVLPDTAGLDTEQAQAAIVVARRGRTASQVLADYESASARALDLLAGLAGQDRELDFGDFGRYPACVLPSAFAFDHYTHIRADLFAPRGPLAGPPPPSDELRLGPALDWVEAALPQQNGALLAGLAGSITISVDGAGGRSIRLGQGRPAAQISSDGPALIHWVTQRGSWAALGVRVTGGEAQLSIARSLHVF